MRRIVLAAVMAAAVLPVSPATAGPVEVAVASTAPTLYAPPTVVLPQGASLRLVQLDPVARHDVVSRHQRNRQPIFSNTRTLAFGETEVVAGTDALVPGTYPFTCSIHEWMAGTLEVR